MGRAGKAILLIVCVCILGLQPAAKAEAVQMQRDLGPSERPGQEETDDDAELQRLIRLYEEYEARFAAIEKISDIEDNGFAIIKEQSFPVILESFGEEEVTFLSIMEEEYWGY